MGFILYELSNTKSSFATRLLEQSTNRIYNELDEFFTPVENMLFSLRRQQESTFPQFNNSNHYNHFFIPIIEQYSQISSVGIADNRGYEFNILPNQTDSTWLNREVFVDQWGSIEKWNKWNLTDDNTLQHRNSWESELDYDPRNRPWFKGAIAQSEIFWTEPYTYMTGDVGITASLHWEDEENDSLTNILAIDVTLEDLSNFLKDLEITNNNETFLLTSDDNKIIGLSQDIEDLKSSDLENKLMSTPDEFENQALIQLIDHPLEEYVSFQSNNKRWWGTLKPYKINQTQELLIAILIPESDFSAEIDRTRNAVIAGFIVILILSLVLVRNQGRIRKFSDLVNKKNQLINEQKDQLFSEVHHRVKNNLAIMSAFIEIENMNSQDEAVNHALSQALNRLQSMSVVHEILYESKDIKRINVNDILDELLELSKFERNNITLKAKEVIININQALTFALLVNELLNDIYVSKYVPDTKVKLGVEEKNGITNMEIVFTSNTSSGKIDNKVEKQLIDVLLKQLQATMNTTIHDSKIKYGIVFKLQDVKGITSNQSI